VAFKDLSLQVAMEFQSQAELWGGAYANEMDMLLEIRKARMSESARESARARYAADPEAARARSNAWRQANPEAVKAVANAWKKANPERVKSYVRAQYKASKVRKREELAWKLEREWGGLEAA
jgi:ABC-type nitrate/sulfonate/bicarbonate transport system substrate-binding protein